jgi:hypothetical protein
MRFRIHTRDSSARMGVPRPSAVLSGGWVFAKRGERRETCRRGRPWISQFGKSPKTIFLHPKEFPASVVSMQNTHRQRKSIFLIDFAIPCFTGFCAQGFGSTRYGSYRSSYAERSEFMKCRSRQSCCAQSTKHHTSSQPNVHPRIEPPSSSIPGTLTSQN